jgi:hypothetical protein
MCQLYSDSPRFFLQPTVPTKLTEIKIISLSKTQLGYSKRAHIIFESLMYIHKNYLTESY